MDKKQLMHDINAQTIREAFTILAKRDEYIATVGAQFVVVERRGKANIHHMYLSDRITDATCTVLSPEEAINYIMNELKVERDKIAIWQKVA